VEKSLVNLECYIFTRYLDLLQTVYSPDDHPIYFIPVLNHDCSIHMDAKASYATWTQCFGAYLLSLAVLSTNLIIIINSAFAFTGVIKIC
jgi:hypothetical protein